MSNDTMQYSSTSGVSELRKLLDGMLIEDIAVEFESLEKTEIVKRFRLLSKDKAAEVFADLNPDIQQLIIESITDKEIGSVIDELFLDEAVDFIEEMPSNVVKRVLANVTPDTREMIDKFLMYPTDSAGSIMTIEYVELKADMTVEDAFSSIERTGIDNVTIYTCCVTDAERRLIGTISARRLLLSDQESRIGDIMETNVIFAHTHDDRETVVNNLVRYGFIAMPVVDNEERLVGIITFDDAFTVQEEEATEDFEKMAAILPSEEAYLKTGVFTLSKHRIPWLMLLMVFATLTGELIALFEHSLAALPALVAFIPLLMNAGGNAGSQSTTLIIRGMAIAEIEQKDLLRVLWTETRVSLVCGFVLALSSLVSVILMKEGFPLAMTVSAAMLAVILMSNATGVFMTFGARALKIDPAIMAAPLLTNIIDAMALVVYLLLAKAILHI